MWFVQVAGLGRLGGTVLIDFAFFFLGPRCCRIASDDASPPPPQIGSFKEVAFVARMPALRVFSLSNPDWGDNPVTALCNYQARSLSCCCRALHPVLHKRPIVPRACQASRPWRLPAQTWAAFTLKQLTKLDTATLTDESKALAEATYMKAPAARFLPSPLPCSVVDRYPLHVLA